MDGRDLKQDQLRARVFVSCGQSKESDENQIANLISDRLKELGFDPYVAVAEQTLRGLKENIFEQLRKSEYFVFVDFKREALGNTQPPVHRGSLFSHQELAIASFLDIDVLAFQETGVKHDDGLIRFLQVNAIPFSDRHTLPNVVADIVKRRDWNPNWRNELVLEREPQEFTDAQGIGSGEPEMRRHFHINVHNRHPAKLATNCSVYLEKATMCPNTSIPLNTIEFKWAGTWLASVAIAPRTKRAFDAFHILHSRPTQLVFNALTDSSEYYPRFPEGAAQYRLFYLVTAENFPPARGSFLLNLNKSLDATELVPAS